MYSMMWSETVLHRLPGLVTLPPGLHNECVTAIRQRHNGTHPLLWSKGPWWSRCWRCQPVGSRGTCNRSCFGMLLTKAAGLGLKIVSICIYIYIYFTDFNGSGHIGNLYYSLILPSECIGRFKQVSNETSNLVLKGRGVPFKFSILGSLANSNGLCVYSEIQWSTMWTSCAPNKLQLPKSAFVAISVATIVATWSRSTGFPLAALAYDVWCLPTGSWKFNT